MGLVVAFATSTLQELKQTTAMIRGGPSALDGPAQVAYAGENLPCLWSQPLSPTDFQHPRFTRRTAIQAGAIGLLGLGVHHQNMLRGEPRPMDSKARACIYIFLSGGLSQLDSFDLKPEAPVEIRGEFRPIATRTPGVHICEHLPKLAERSSRFALVRSLTHSTNDHSVGHQIMLSGRSELPPGFDPNRPRPQDWPSIAALVGYASPVRNNLPPAVILPEKLVHTTGRVIPGAFAGQLGPKWDPWLIEASPYHPQAYGAFPQYEFDHQERRISSPRRSFVMPHLELPEDLLGGRFPSRLKLLAGLEAQCRVWSEQAEHLDHSRQQAVSLLTRPEVRRAFDIAYAKPEDRQRYGDNSFGWSLLIARQLVEAGVNLVQVNLGNNETWDTHGNAFPHLKDKLFPPTDQAVSALLDDLYERGMLEQTLVVMASEFGRTPKISTLPQFYKLPGRDHWGAVQTVLFAGGGVQGGRVVGSSDRIGAYPRTDPQTPESFAATIFQALGIPSDATWYDVASRPQHYYHSTPIDSLF